MDFFIPIEESRCLLKEKVKLGVNFSPEDALRRGVYSPQELYTFPDTRVGGSSTLKVNVRNNSPETHEVRSFPFSLE